MTENISIEDLISLSNISFQTLLQKSFTHNKLNDNHYIYKKLQNDYQANNVSTQLSTLLQKDIKNIQTCRSGQNLANILKNNDQSIFDTYQDFTPNFKIPLTISFNIKKVVLALGQFLNYYIKFALFYKDINQFKQISEWFYFNDEQPIFVADIDQSYNLNQIYIIAYIERDYGNNLDTFYDVFDNIDLQDQLSNFKQNTPYDLLDQQIEHLEYLQNYLLLQTYENVDQVGIIRQLFYIGYIQLFNNSYDELIVDPFQVQSLNKFQFYRPKSKNAYIDLITATFQEQSDKSIQIKNLPIDINLEYCFLNSGIISNKNNIQQFILYQTFYPQYLDKSRISPLNQISSLFNENSILFQKFQYPLIKNIFKTSIQTNPIHLNNYQKLELQSTNQQNNIINQLFISLLSINVTNLSSNSCRNILVKLEFKKGNQIIQSFHSKIENISLFSQISSAAYHEKQSKLFDTFKIELPLILTNEYHFFFTVYHISFSQLENDTIKYTQTINDSFTENFLLNDPHLIYLKDSKVIRKVGVGYLRLKNKNDFPFTLDLRQEEEINIFPQLLSNYWEMPPSSQKSSITQKFIPVIKAKIDINSSILNICDNMQTNKSTNQYITVQQILNNQLSFHYLYQSSLKSSNILKKYVFEFSNSTHSLLLQIQQYIRGQKKLTNQLQQNLISLIQLVLNNSSYMKIIKFTDSNQEKEILLLHMKLCLGISKLIQPQNIYQTIQQNRIIKYLDLTKQEQQLYFTKSIINSIRSAEEIKQMKVQNIQKYSDMFNSNYLSSLLQKLQFSKEDILCAIHFTIQVIQQCINIQQYQDQIIQTILYQSQLIFSITQENIDIELFIGFQSFYEYSLIFLSQSTCSKENIQIKNIQYFSLSLAQFIKVFENPIINFENINSQIILKSFNHFSQIFFPILNHLIQYQVLGVQNLNKSIFQIQLVEKFLTSLFFNDLMQTTYYESSVNIRLLLSQDFINFLQSFFNLLIQLLINTQITLLSVDAYTNIYLLIIFTIKNFEIINQNSYFNELFYQQLIVIFLEFSCQNNFYTEKSNIQFFKISDFSIVLNIFQQYYQNVKFQRQHLSQDYSYLIEILKYRKYNFIENEKISEITKLMIFSDSAGQKMYKEKQLDVINEISVQTTEINYPFIESTFVRTDDNLIDNNKSTQTIQQIQMIQGPWLYQPQNLIQTFQSVQTEINIVIKDLIYYLRNYLQQTEFSEYRDIWLVFQNLAQLLNFEQISFENQILISNILYHNFRQFIECKQIKRQNSQILAKGWDQLSQSVLSNSIQYSQVYQRTSDYFRSTTRLSFQDIYSNIQKAIWDLFIQHYSQNVPSIIQLIQSSIEFEFLVLKQASPQLDLSFFNANSRLQDKIMQFADKQQQQILFQQFEKLITPIDLKDGKLQQSFNNVLAQIVIRLKSSFEEGLKQALEATVRVGQKDYTDIPKLLESYFKSITVYEQQVGLKKDMFERIFKLLQENDYQLELAYCYLQMASFISNHYAIPLNQYLYSFGQKQQLAQMSIQQQFCFYPIVNKIIKAVSPKNIENVENNEIFIQYTDAKIFEKILTYLKQAYDIFLSYGVQELSFIIDQGIKDLILYYYQSLPDVLQKKETAQLISLYSMTKNLIKIGQKQIGFFYLISLHGQYLPDSFNDKYYVYHYPQSQRIADISNFLSIYYDQYYKNILSQQKIKNHPQKIVQIISEIDYKNRFLVKKTIMLSVKKGYDSIQVETQLDLAENYIERKKTYGDVLYISVQEVQPFQYYSAIESQMQTTFISDYVIKEISDYFRSQAHIQYKSQKIEANQYISEFSAFNKVLNLKIPLNNHVFTSQLPNFEHPSKEPNYTGKLVTYYMISQPLPSHVIREPIFKQFTIMFPPRLTQAANLYEQANNLLRLRQSLSTPIQEQQINQIQSLLFGIFVPTVQMGPGILFQKFNDETPLKSTETIKLDINFEKHVQQLKDEKIQFKYQNLKKVIIDIQQEMSIFYHSVQFLFNEGLGCLQVIKDNLETYPQLQDVYNLVNQRINEMKIQIAKSIDLQSIQQ